MCVFRKHLLTFCVYKRSRCQVCADVSERGANSGPSCGNLPTEADQTWVLLWVLHPNRCFQENPSARACSLCCPQQDGSGPACSRSVCLWTTPGHTLPWQPVFILHLGVAEVARRGESLSHVCSSGALEIV